LPRRAERARAAGTYSQLLPFSFAWIRRRGSGTTVESSDHRSGDKRAHRRFRDGDRVEMTGEAAGKHREAQHRLEASMLRARSD